MNKLKTIMAKVILYTSLLLLILSIPFGCQSRHVETTQEDEFILTLEVEKTLYSENEDIKAVASIEYTGINEVELIFGDPLFDIGIKDVDELEVINQPRNSAILKRGTKFYRSEDSKLFNVPSGEYTIYVNALFSTHDKRYKIPVEIDLKVKKDQ